MSEESDLKTVNPVKWFHVSKNKLTLYNKSIKYPNKTNATVLTKFLLSNEPNSELLVPEYMVLTNKLS